MMALQEASDTLNLLEGALHHVEEIQEDDVSSVDIRRMLREISLVFKPSLGFQSSAVVSLQAASETFNMMEREGLDADEEESGVNVIDLLYIIYIPDNVLVF